MSLNQLANCPQCGKLFVRGARDLCADCYKEEEAKYKLVYEYLRQKENKMATIHVVSEDTGVEVSLITKFIRQGRLSLEGLPNLGIPCEACGEITRDGHMCKRCRDRFLASVQRMHEEDVEKVKIQGWRKELGYQQVKNRLTDD